MKYKFKQAKLLKEIIQMIEDEWYSRFNKEYSNKIRITNWII